MTAKNVYFSCLTAFICMLSPVSAFAAGAEPIETAVCPDQLTDEDSQRDISLLSDWALSISNDSSTVYITAYTLSCDTMDEIGQIDIEVQQSYNGVNGWSYYASVPNQTSLNSDSHYTIGYPVGVTNGYYYRVVLTHYAKEPGWIFHRTQSEEQISGIIRVY